MDHRPAPAWKTAVQRALGKKRTLLIAAACAVGVAVAAACAAFTAATSVQGTRDAAVAPTAGVTAVSDDVATQDAASEAAEEPPALPGGALDYAAATVQLLDAAAADEHVNLFDASGAVRDVDPSEIPEVARALEAYAQAGYDAGFIVFDLEAGCGLGYNADLEVFSASTIKAPFVAYVLQALVDGGQASLSDVVFEDTTVAGTGVMAFDDFDAYDLQTVLYNTIAYSDNTGYALLRELFDAEGFAQWAGEIGVDIADWEGAWYPYCTARDLARLWMHIGAYVKSGGESSAFMEDLLSQSSNSFLREALGDGHRVFSKPGFEIDDGMSAGFGYRMSALNEAGFVEGPNGSYLIAIMSNADYDSEFYTDNAQLIEGLITALDAAHAQLLAAEADAA